MSTAPPRPHRPAFGDTPWVWGLGLALAGLAWVALYAALPTLSDAMVARLPVDRHSPTGEALAFFFYDAPKVLALLVLVVFLMGILRSFFSAERTRALLSSHRIGTGTGHVLAAGLGVLTPFCSCSAVPLFVGFVSAGVPLGITFSFLIAAPMVNEVALILLVGLVGWPVALAYLVVGLGIAIAAGWVIGRLRLEGWLQDWVRDMHSRAATPPPPNGQGQGQGLTLADRCRLGGRAVVEIVGKVWIWILIGIAVGALIHGYVPADLLTSIMGADSWWSVPAAVALGVPLYSNAAGIIPVIEALLGKGAALGTVLAFMMSVIALSLPELIILRQVLTLRLIAVFVGIVAGGILTVGLLFNLLVTMGGSP